MSVQSQGSPSAVAIAAPPATSGATFIASTPFVLGDFNLYFYNAFGTATSFQKNANVVFDGQTYPDAFGVQANFGNNNLRELDFLGSGFTQDISGNITGGTVNVIADFNLTTSTVNWLLEGVSMSAGALYNTALTPLTNDENALLASALSGNDTIILSWGNDVMSGFAGDDVIISGAGVDGLFGGGGNDTRPRTALVKAPMKASIPFKQASRSTKSCTRMSKI